MKNIIYRLVSILVFCTLVIVYLYTRDDKKNNSSMLYSKPKDISTLKQGGGNYASKEEEEFAAGFKIGIMAECKRLNKQAPIRIDDGLILKDVLVTDKVITYIYQFEFEKSEADETELEYFISSIKDDMKYELFSRFPKDSNISLSRTLELADIKLEYIVTDINDTVITNFQLDYIDFYGM